MDAMPDPPGHLLPRKKCTSSAKGYRSFDLVDRESDHCGFANSPQVGRRRGFLHESQCQEDKAFCLLAGELTINVDGGDFTGATSAWVTLAKASIHRGLLKNDQSRSD
jgi:hypothetical protein